MKTLALNVYFLLPDEFAGDLNDALREVIKYRESVGSKPLPDGPDATKVSQEELWAGFLKTREEGKRLYGTTSLKEYRDGEWHPIGARAGG
jgi:hypothetical protein